MWEAQMRKRTLKNITHRALPKASDLDVGEPVTDANTVVTLDPKKVAEARASELEWVKRQGAYKKISEDTCYAWNPADIR